MDTITKELKVSTEYYSLTMSVDKVEDCYIDEYCGGQVKTVKADSMVDVTGIVIEGRERSSFFQHTSYKDMKGEKLTLSIPKAHLERGHYKQTSF